MPATRPSDPTESLDDSLGTNRLHLPWFDIRWDCAQHGQSDDGTKHQVRQNHYRFYLLPPSAVPALRSQSTLHPCRARPREMPVLVPGCDAFQPTRGVGRRLRFESGWIIQWMAVRL